MSWLNYVVREPPSQSPESHFSDTLSNAQAALVGVWGGVGGYLADLLSSQIKSCWARRWMHETIQQCLRTGSN